MGCLCSNLQLALQLWDPALHQMDIIEENPSTILDIFIKDSLCRLLLTLAHGNEGQLAVLDTLALLVGVDFNLLGGRVPGEENEKDGG